jgi:hypothetical protein
MVRKNLLLNHNEETPMNRPQFAPRYTASRVLPFAPPGYMSHHAPGTCKSCGQPSGQCGCGCRECRKESKEIVVRANASTGATAGSSKFDAVFATAMKQPHGFATINTGPDVSGLTAAGAAASLDKSIDTAFIGGGCCVHIAVEYAPIVPTALSRVMIIVGDSEGTLLAWMKTEQPGTHYQVKENVITTKPGATIIVAVDNATARVRWCETFSC